MESVATRPATPESRILQRIDPGAVGLWALAGGLVIYLAFAGGGYDIVVHNQVGIIVWWLVLLGAAWGLLPAARLSRLAWAGLALFGGFVAWTALASTWSLSSERSLQSLSLVAGYLGVLVLGIGVHRERDRAVRHTVTAIATAIVLVAVLAVTSRLRPGLIASADQTASFLGSTTQQRLGWPLNYWNALAALLAFGLPLLLSLATSARSLLAQAGAAASLPLLVLCSYLTFSRGGALAGAVALIVFIALAPERLMKLATALTAGIGGAILVAGAVHRSAIEHGLTTAAARSQGNSLMVTIVLVCAGVGLAQVGIALAGRHAQPRKWMTVSRRTARGLLAVGLAVCLVALVILAASGTISHEWQQFKNSKAASVTVDSLGRFGVASGNGRYDLWKAALDSTSGHLLKGAGPGTFQLLWLPRAPYFSYVQNAHSLYFETLAEVGLIGLALLLGFMILVVAAGVRLVTQTSYEARTRAAAATAALVAFAVSAGVDWVWQVPVLPVAFMLVAAAVLAPRLPAGADPRARTPSGPTAWVTRGGVIVLALASLIAIAIPLATTNAVRDSQAAAAATDYASALSDAQAAARVEPGAASPQIQIALVLEAQRDRRGALVAARRATRDEPANWSNWLVLSRLEAETGHALASVSAYRHARSLNPRSPIFAQ
jgi:hypothetical protein